MHNRKLHNVELEDDSGPDLRLQCLTLAVDLFTRESDPALPDEFEVERVLDVAQKFSYWVRSGIKKPYVVGEPNA
jgi:hypothetical protein